MPERISVVGMGGDGLKNLAESAVQALSDASLVVGSPRHLDAVRSPGEGSRREVALTADLDAAFGEIGAETGTVCVLASGDPGFFGIVRPLAQRFGAQRLDVHPGPSSVSMAFARIGMPWDDAVVVSAHGRSLAAAARVAASEPKVAVLVSPESPPQALGRALLALGARHQRAVVCTRIGTPEERTDVVDLAALADGCWDPLSVVILLADAAADTARVLAWGLPDGSFDHREGMITHSEVRAVALGKLALPSRGVLWDVGAGSGSVAIECALLCRCLRVMAVEEKDVDARRVSDNASAHGAIVEVVTGRAPAVLGALPDPDRAFVGGGGAGVLRAVLDRLRPGGRIVATYAALDRAAAAADLLGGLVQVGVSRGRRLPDGGLRLSAENPVFVVWGPSPA